MKLQEWGNIAFVLVKLLFTEKCILVFICFPSCNKDPAMSIEKIYINLIYI